MRLPQWGRPTGDNTPVSQRLGLVDEGKFYRQKEIIKWLSSGSRVTCT